MERLLRIASPLGLFAEEFDVDTGYHLGNFPQAFSHLALIEAAGRIIATEARRAHRRVTANLAAAKLLSGGGTGTGSRIRWPIVVAGEVSEISVGQWQRILTTVGWPSLVTPPASTAVVHPMTAISEPPLGEGRWSCVIRRRQGSAAVVSRGTFGVALTGLPRQSGRTGLAGPEARGAARHRVCSLQCRSAEARNYSIRRPAIARAMTSCWISDVPSKIVWIICRLPSACSS